MYFIDWQGLEIFDSISYNEKDSKLEWTNTLTNIVSAAEIPRNTQRVRSFQERVIEYNSLSLLLTQVCMPSSRRGVLKSKPGPLYNDSSQWELLLYMWLM